MAIWILVGGRPIFWKALKFSIYPYFCRPDRIIATPLTKTSTSSAHSAKTSTCRLCSATTSTCRLCSAKTSTCRLRSVKTSTFSLYTAKTSTCRFCSVKTNKTLNIFQYFLCISKKKKKHTFILKKQRRFGLTSKRLVYTYSRYRCSSRRQFLRLAAAAEMGRERYSGGIMHRLGSHNNNSWLDKLR